MAKRPALFLIFLFGIFISFSLSYARNSLSQSSNSCVTVNSSSANIRSGAGTTYSIVGTATRDQELTVLSQSGTGNGVWYSVKTSTGINGWISASVVTSIPCSNNSPVSTSSSQQSLVSDQVGEACKPNGVSISATIPAQKPAVGFTGNMTVGGNWKAKVGTTVTFVAGGGSRLYGGVKNYIQLHLLDTRNRMTFDIFAKSGDSKSLTYTFTKDQSFAVNIAGTNGDILTLAVTCALPVVSLPPTTQPPIACRNVSIQINTNEANGVVSGNLLGLIGCTAVVTITNERPYWVNYKVSAIGNGVTFEPSAGYNNFFTQNNVLPPNGSVNYEVAFTARSQQTFTALLDKTPVSGSMAQKMIATQAIVDTLTVLVPEVPSDEIFKLGYETFPEILQTLQSLKHWGKALDALTNLPPDFDKFSQEVELARQFGEFDTLADELQKLGWDVLKKEISINGGAFTKRLSSLTDSIIRSYSGALEVLITGKVAGSVTFISQ